MNEWMLQEKNPDYVCSLHEIYGDENTFSHQLCASRMCANGNEMNKPNITEAEWPIMKYLWERETATAGEIVNAVKKERKVSMRTVKTLIRRLVAKEAVTFVIDETNPRVYHYKAMLSREACAEIKKRSILELVYEGKIGSLLASFLKDSALDKEEISRLRDLLKMKEEENKD